MEEKDRAEYIHRLAKDAAERAHRLIDMEWKFVFPLWTGFGAASGFVLQSDKWVPSKSDCILSVLITSGILFSYIIWASWVRKHNGIYSARRTFWESVLQKIIDIELPESLFIRKDMILFGRNNITEYHYIPWYKWPPSICRVFITLFFACLFLGAVLGKYFAIH